MSNQTVSKDPSSRSPLLKPIVALFRLAKNGLTKTKQAFSALAEEIAWYKQDILYLLPCTLCGPEGLAAAAGGFALGRLVEEFGYSRKQDFLFSSLFVGLLFAGSLYMGLGVSNALQAKTGNEGIITDSLLRGTLEKGSVVATSYRRLPLFNWDLRISNKEIFATTVVDVSSTTPCAHIKSDFWLPLPGIGEKTICAAFDPRPPEYSEAEVKYAAPAPR